MTVPRLTGRELEDLQHLRLLPGVGDERLRLVLERYGSPGRALRAARAAELGTAAAAARGSPPVLERARRCAGWLEEAGAHVLLDSDSRYPETLRHLHRPPAVIYAIGQLKLLTRPIVALVGARRCTEYGADVARSLAGALAGAGVAVASGLAHGVDVSAHLGALDAGATIAVLGTGPDRSYPLDNAHVQKRIATDGLLLTEFEPGTRGLPHNFPRRNRIIAALAAAVVVVEAGPKSGALITARLALELGREVLAVPGPIGRESSEGTNRLIRDGAGVVLEARDVLDAIGVSAAVPEAAAPSGRSSAPPLGLGALLGAEPRHVDELASRAGIDSARALVALLELELQGVARQLPGMRFARA